MRREVLLGITGKDFTLIAASKASMRGATILKASDDKTRSLNSHTLMAFSGEAGDTSMLFPYAFFLLAFSFSGNRGMVHEANGKPKQFNLPNTSKPTPNYTVCAMASTSHPPPLPTSSVANSHPPSALASPTT